MENTKSTKYNPEEGDTLKTFFKDRRGHWNERTQSYVPSWDQTIVEVLRLPTRAGVKAKGFCIIVEGRCP
jgi:hypothetical protein